MKKIGGIIASLVLTLILILPVSAADLFQKDLKYGMSKNSEVKRLQTYLKGEGFYKGSISGNYYGLTQAAIVKLQKKYGIKPANGKFTKVTRDKINSLLLAKEDTEQVAASADTQNEAQQLAESIEALKQYELVKVQQPQIITNDQTKTLTPEEFAIKYPEIKPISIKSPITQVITQADKDSNCKSKANEAVEEQKKSGGFYKYPDVKISPDYTIVDPEVPEGVNSSVNNYIKRAQENKERIKEKVNQYNTVKLRYFNPAVEPIWTEVTCPEIMASSTLSLVSSLKEQCVQFQKEIDDKKKDLFNTIETFEQQQKNALIYLDQLYKTTFGSCILQP